MMQKARQVMRSNQQAAGEATAASECSGSDAAASNGSCSSGQIQQRGADESAK